MSDDEFFSEEEVENVEENSNDDGDDTLLDEEDEEDNDENIEDIENETDKFYTIDSPEYKKYLEQILDKETHIDKDKMFRTYTLTDKTKLFIENIKPYGLNLPIVKSHYKKLAKQLLEEEEPSIINELIVVEYTEFKTKYKKSLCALFDGHHRKKAIEECIKINPNIKIKIRVCIIQSNFPDSIETKKLFRKFNSIKPFSIDFNAMEMSDSIITKLNNEFNIKGFELIKDNKKAYRPSIEKSKINDAIQNRLEYLKKIKYYNNNDIIIDLIIAEFVKYNTYIKINKLYENEKGITSAMIEKASKYECFLGLVNIVKTVNKCICEKYN
jgi:hypothetical protein